MLAWRCSEFLASEDLLWLNSAVGCSEVRCENDFPNGESVRLEWHLGKRNAGGASDRGKDLARHPSEVSETVYDRPPSLPSVWVRILSGQSFGWRLRRMRNRLWWRARRGVRLGRGLVRRTRWRARRGVRLGRGLVRRSRWRILRRRRRSRTVVGQSMRKARRHAVVLRKSPWLLVKHAIARFRGTGRQWASVPYDREVFNVPLRPSNSLTHAVLAQAVRFVDEGPEARFPSIEPAPTELPSARMVVGRSVRWIPAHASYKGPPSVAHMPSLDRPSTLFELPLSAASPRAYMRSLSGARQRLWVECSGVRGNPENTARWIIELAGAGAVLVPGAMDSEVAQLIGPELLDVVRSTSGLPLHNRQVRERQSVRLRRAVHRSASNFEGVAELMAHAGHAVRSWPKVSVLLATNRPEMIRGAIDMILQQRYPDFEIVCGLHGFEASPAVFETAQAAGRDVRIHTAPSDADFGLLLRDLAKLAQGDLVTKWDDDDWYAPDHLVDLVSAMRYSGAEVVGKAAEYVFLESEALTIQRFSQGRESFSTTIAGGTLMLGRKYLDSLGGWPAGQRRVDRLLLERVERVGGRIYRMHGDGYLLRRSARPADHTWTVESDYFVAQAEDTRDGLNLEFAGVTS